MNKFNSLTVWLLLLSLSLRLVSCQEVKTLFLFLSFTLIFIYSPDGKRFKYDIKDGARIEVLKSGGFMVQDSDKLVKAFFGNGWAWSYQNLGNSDEAKK